MGDMALDFEGGFVSPQDYLRWEARSQTRHEYIDGQVYAMGGASGAHGLLALRFGALLDSRLPDECLAFVADMKVRIKTDVSERYYYPDVIVTCEPLRLDAHICEKPLIIVEILSPSTERFDRNEKFDRYKAIASLQEYVLVRQDAPRVEVYRRKNDWRRESFFIEDGFALDAVGLDFSVSQLYRRLGFGEGA